MKYQYKHTCDGTLTIEQLFLQFQGVNVCGFF